MEVATSWVGPLPFGYGLVFRPDGSAFTVRDRSIVTFRPIRFPSDVSHTPPPRAACPFVASDIDPRQVVLYF
jgi:hypothetical protein